MIRPLQSADRAARRREQVELARYWRRVFVPFAVLNLEGRGRCIIVMRTLQTRLSESRGCRVWRVPA